MSIGARISRSITASAFLRRQIPGCLLDWARSLANTSWRPAGPATSGCVRYSHILRMDSCTECTTRRSSPTRPMQSTVRTLTKPYCARPWKGSAPWRPRKSLRPRGEIITSVWRRGNWSSQGSCHFNRVTEPDRVNSRKLRQDAKAKARPVVAQAASATQTIACDTELSGGKSAASDNRKLARAYIPSGNTRLQNIGV